MSDEQKEPEIQQMPEQMPAEDLKAMRIRKVEKIVEEGGNPYGHRVMGLTSCQDAKAAYAKLAEGDTMKVKIAGRMTAKRVMGKSLFAKVIDQDGAMQLYVQKNVVGDEPYAQFKALDIGDILSAEGELFTTHTGEVSIRVESYELLSKSLRPLPEKWHGLSDMEQRYRQRYVDLICNDDVRRTFQLRSRIIHEIRARGRVPELRKARAPQEEGLAGTLASLPGPFSPKDKRRTSASRAESSVFV